MRETRYVKTPTETCAESVKRKYYSKLFITPPDCSFQYFFNVRTTRKTPNRNAKLSRYLCCFKPLIARNYSKLRESVADFLS